jgi:hypothetical protein
MTGMVSGTTPSPVPRRAPRPRNYCTSPYRVHLQEGDLTGANPVDRGKAGSKLHLAGERGGLPISVVLSAANANDATMFEAVLDDIPPITPHPVGDWVAQQARNLLMEIGDDLGQFRFVIRDRDAKFTAGFAAVFAAAAIKVLVTPVRAPRANAYAERWVGTVPVSCLTGCSSSDAGSYGLCWPSTSTTTTCTVRTGPRAGAAAPAGRTSGRGDGWKGHTTRSAGWADP